jgi:hypothetical protein
MLAEAARHTSETEALFYFSCYEYLFWVLDDAQQERLLRLTPDAFGDRALWGLALAGTYALRRDGAHARAYADSARATLATQFRSGLENPDMHAALGVAYAYLGRERDAVREGERAVALVPIEKDALAGPSYLLQLVRIYILVGEPAQALDGLERLLRVPSLLSPGRLRVDPTFAPLRGNPRFERLARGG